MRQKAQTETHHYVLGSRSTQTYQQISKTKDYSQIGFYCVNYNYSQVNPQGGPKTGYFKVL